MLTKIIGFSIKNKLIVGLFILFLIGLGGYELKHLPIDAVPDITNNQTQIITVAPSMGAPDIERLITFPIEQANSNIPGLKETRSFSRFGLSIVTLIFEDKTDIYWARQQISERLTSVNNSLPKGVDLPFLAPVSTGLGEVYQYTVRPKQGYEDKYDAMELRSIQDWIVRRQLLSVKGVADVSSFGGYQKQYEITIDPQRLSATGVTIEEIYTALEANNQNTGGAYIEKGPLALFIRTEGLLSSIADIAAIEVKQLENNTPLLIGDVATVQLGHATPYGALTYNGELQVAGAVVLMLKGANSNDVISNIKEKVVEIQKTLPEGVVIEPFLDRTKMVNNAITTVSTNLIEGALIVIFVLVLFLGNIRAGFIVASVIPLSMLFAIICMNLFGVSGNLMSLGALDFGLIVDGAVIIVEAVLHGFMVNKTFATTNRLSQEQMDSTVKSYASRMMNSAVFGQIIILIVYLPIFTLQGIEGKMFKPMAQTVAFALVGAFILSLTYVPMMSSLVLSKNITHQPTFSDRIMGKLEHFYSHTLKRALLHPKLILSSVLALFAFSIFLLTRIGGEFIPALPEGDFAVETRVLTGSSLTTSVDAASKSSKILLERFPEIKQIVTKTGSSEIPTDPMPVDQSDMIIVLKDRKEWTSVTSYEELEKKMLEALAEIPGVSFGFQFPVAMRFNELISGAKQDVVLKISGENLDTLQHYAKNIGAICSSTQGTTGLYVEAVSGMPQIVVEYKRQQLAQYGITIQEINRVINTSFAGELVGQVYEGEKRFDLVIRQTSAKRKDLTDVQNLLIPSKTGAPIPLHVLADVELIDSPNQIQRDNSQRRIMVGFNLDGRDVQSVVSELQQKIEQKIQLPVGYTISYGGSFKNLEAAKERLFIAVPLSLLLIFVLLYFPFKSLKQGLIIYSAIPLSAIGGIIALSLRGLPFSISAGVGFIALFGVAVLNGIILISEFNRLQQQGELSLGELILQGASSRLRPVLMTASVASLGFLPMALSHGEGAEVQRPLATVVIGGLLVATLLTLFVLPILYTMIQKKSKLPTSLPLLVAFICCYSFVSAQTSISLEKAQEIALSKNKNLKNERLLSEYQKQLSKSGVTIPHTSVTSEIGQINSYYSDLAIGVQQSFNFPTVYSHQKKVLLEEWKQNVLQVNLQENELMKEVALSYFELAYLYQKKKLASEINQIYKERLEKITTQFQVGQVNALEISTAEVAANQIQMQQELIEQDLQLAQLKFQLLLNSDVDYLPENDKAQLHQLVQVNDSTMILNHPMLQVLQQEEQLSKANTQLEKSRMLPDFTVGYKGMSMKGTGSNNLTYDSNIRFHSFNVGIGIPLFFGSQQTRIKAAKIQEQVAKGKLEIAQQQLQLQFKQLIERYQRSENRLQLFEEKTLKNSQTIRSTANQYLENGSISYIEWGVLLNQSIQIENEYIETVCTHNKVIVEINSYIKR